MHTTACHFLPFCHSLKVFPPPFLVFISFINDFLVGLVDCLLRLLNEKQKNKKAILSFSSTQTCTHELMIFNNILSRHAANSKLSTLYSILFNASELTQLKYNPTQDSNTGISYIIQYRTCKVHGISPCGGYFPFLARLTKLSMSSLPSLFHPSLHPNLSALSPPIFPSCTPSQSAYPPPPSPWASLSLPSCP